MSSLRPRDGWRVAGISIIMLLLLTFVLYQQTILYLIGKWNQLEIGKYGHGYLVLAISAYLVFYNRLMLVALTPCPEYRGIVAVVSASMLWLIAALVDIEMLQTVGLLLLVLSILWALLGSQVTRILVFPVFILALPFPSGFHYPHFAGSNRRCGILDNSGDGNTGITNRKYDCITCCW